MSRSDGGLSEGGDFAGSMPKLDMVNHRVWRIGMSKLALMSFQAHLCFLAAVHYITTAAPYTLGHLNRSSRLSASAMNTFMPNHAASDSGRRITTTHPKQPQGTHKERSDVYLSFQPLYAVVDLSLCTLKSIDVAAATHPSTLARCQGYKPTRVPYMSQHQRSTRTQPTARQPPLIFRQTTVYACYIGLCSVDLSNNKVIHVFLYLPLRRVGG